MSGWKSEKNGVRKSLQEALDLRPSVISERLRTQVVPAMRNAWIDIINQRVSAERRQRMVDGIRISHNDLSLTLKGWDAVRTERGWAPVRGTDIFSDGLGKYTGTQHDMKPIILGGKRTKTIKFESSKTIKETADHYRRLLEISVQSMRANNIDVEAMHKTFLKRLRALPYSSPWEFGNVIDHKGLLFPKLKWYHTDSIFARIHKHAHKSKRRYVLTIYREMHVNQPNKWLTHGTPPANTIPKLVEKLPEILVDVFFGR